MKKMFYFLSLICVHTYFSNHTAVESNFCIYNKNEVQDDDPGRYAPNTSGQVNWITDGDEEKAEKKDFP